MKNSIPCSIHSYFVLLYEAMLTNLIPLYCSLLSLYVLPRNLLSLHFLALL